MNRKNIDLMNVAFVSRHLAGILVFLLIITLSLGYFASKLKLHSDFEDLLPRTFFSVQSLDEITEKFGGTGYLVLDIVSDDLEASKRFAYDLVKRLESLDEVRYVDWQQPRKYFEDRKLLYMDLEDLETINDRIKEKIKSEKQKANPLFIDLLEEDYELDFSDIEEKYKGKNIFREYYTSEDNRHLILLLKPAGLAGNLDFSRRLLSKVKEVIDGIRPYEYHPSISVAFTGRYKKQIDVNDVINRDLKVTAVAAAIFIALLLIVYFKKVRAIFIIGLPLITSVIWTFGLAYLAIGYINIITGFLAAILLGLGIDYGVHLYNRYLEQRSTGGTAAESLLKTQAETGKAVITAGITTAISFFSLLIAEFKGFSQFGFIAGTGVVLSLAAFFILFPALILLSERMFGPEFKESSIAERKPVEFRYHIIILTICLVFTVFSLLKINKIGFEYSFSKLQGSNIPSFILDEQVNEIMGVSLTPAIVLVDDLEEAGEVSEYLENEESVEGSTIDQHASFLSFLPEEQDKKFKVLREIRDTVDDDLLNILAEDQKEYLDELKGLLDIERITLDNLPLQVRRQFLGIKAGKGMAVYIFPKIDLGDAKLVRQFSDRIRNIEISTRTVHACSESVIFSDILNMIGRDGKKVLLFTFIAVTLFVLLDLRSVKGCIMVLSPLLMGISWIFGIMYLLSMKFNFLNVVIFPLIFGIGVDNGVHIYHRYKEEGEGSLFFVLMHTGKAVMISCLTSMIGFSALLFAKHNGLNTIGQLALIGIGSTFIVAVTFLPALLRYLEKRKREGV